jgi:hypothetical protein
MPNDTVTMMHDIIEAGKSAGNGLSQNCQLRVLRRSHQGIEILQGALAGDRRAGAPRPPTGHRPRNPFSLTQAVEIRRFIAASAVDCRDQPLEQHPCYQGQAVRSRFCPQAARQSHHKGYLPGEMRNYLWLRRRLPPVRSSVCPPCGVCHPRRQDA